MGDVRTDLVERVAELEHLCDKLASALRVVEFAAQGCCEGCGYGWKQCGYCGGNPADDCPTYVDPGHAHYCDIKEALEMYDATR